MDQQENDGPDVELAASVDEDDTQNKTLELNTKRFHQLAATRLAHTEEQQRNRRYKWNVVRDSGILQRKIELQSEQRRIDLTTLRRLTSPTKGQDTTEPTPVECQKLHAKQMSFLPSKVTSITEQGVSKEASQISLSGHHKRDTKQVKPNIVTQQLYPRLSSTNTFAVHALVELGRRHSSLSSRGSSSMTLNRIESDLDGEYEEVPRSSPVSTIGTFAQSPEPYEDPEIKTTNRENSRPEQCCNDIYLVNLVHLMEGKSLPPPPAPPRRDIQMTAILADGTDGSSFSSLENPGVTKVQLPKSPKQLLLLLIFIGTNILFWCALSHPEGFILAREYVYETFYMKNNRRASRKNYAENLTFALLSPDALRPDIVDHGASSQDTIQEELSNDIFDEQSDPHTTLNDLCEDAIIMEEMFWKPTRVGGPFYSSMIRSVPTELPSNIETCFWFHMHPNQCVVVEDSYCTPVMGGWNGILELSPGILQLPILKIVDRNMLNDYDDVFNQVPLMDVVVNFFRDRRRRRMMNMEKHKTKNLL